MRFLIIFFVFRDVPECSRMFHVLGFVHGLFTSAFIINQLQMTQLFTSVTQNTLTTAKIITCTHNLVACINHAAFLVIAEKLAFEQATVGDRTKEKTASEASLGETVPRGELAEKGLGGGRECPPRPASLGSLRWRPFSSPFHLPYPATGACSQATEKRERWLISCCLM